MNVPTFERRNVTASMTDNHLCELCSSRPAKVMVLRRRHEDIHRTFVCSECANERARLYARTDFDFEHVIARVDERTSNRQPAYSCQFCGTTLADIIADGKPGCCSCYSRFAGEIEQAILSAQEHSHHTGKAPEK